MDHDRRPAPTGARSFKPNLSKYRGAYENPVFYIGKVAQITGASRKAIRHYEALGLLPPAVRRGAYRVYGGKDVFMVHVIKHAQTYGFTLAELHELVAAIGKRDHFPLEVALDAVRRKRAAVRREVKALRLLDRRLGELLADIKQHFR